MRKRTKSYSAINVKSDSMAVTGCNLVKKKKALDGTHKARLSVELSLWEKESGGIRKCLCHSKNKTSLNQESYRWIHK